MTHKPFPFTKDCRNLIRIATISLAAMIIYSLSSCSKPHSKGHACPFALCPFKGITTVTVAACGCEEGSPCYYLDLLHLEYPNAGYDTLDSVFTSCQKKAEISFQVYDAAILREEVSVFTPDLNKGIIK